MFSRSFQLYCAKKFSFFNRTNGRGRNRVSRLKVLSSKTYEMKVLSKLIKKKMFNFSLSHNINSPQEGYRLKYCKRRTYDRNVKIVFMTEMSELCVYDRNVKAVFIT